MSSCLSIAKKYHAEIVMISAGIVSSYLGVNKSAVGSKPVYAAKLIATVLGSYGFMSMLSSYAKNTKKNISNTVVLFFMSIFYLEISSKWRH